VFFLSLLASDTDRIAGALGGLITMTLVAAVLRWLGRGRLGRGDVYFSLLLGAVIGWLDPWAIATAWALTAFSAAVFAGVGLCTGRLARDSAVPFGPFMVLGSVSAMALTLASNS
jgi:leader peptidase (prepilin peptidase)/N-methyltransferase